MMDYLSWTNSPSKLISWVGCCRIHSCYKSIQGYKNMQRRSFISLISLLVCVIVVAVLILPKAASSQSPSGTQAADASKYKIVGYFPQWGMYARNYRVKDIVTTGAAPKLTHINYAFANVGTDSTCYEETRYGWGDATADYETNYSADLSVDGQADEFGQPLKGHFNQLRKLKAMYPNIKVLMSIGGSRAFLRSPRPS